MDQIDVRGWAHCFTGEHRDNIVKTDRGAHILTILTPPVDAPQAIKDEYWSWVEERVLAPIKEQYPDLYSWIVDWYRRLIADMAVTEGGNVTDSTYVRAAKTQAVLELLPPLIRDTLLREPDFREE